MIFVWNNFNLHLHQFHLKDKQKKNGEFHLNRKLFNDLLCVYGIRSDRYHSFFSQRIRQATIIVNLFDFFNCECITIYGKFDLNGKWVIIIQPVEKI